MSTRLTVLVEGRALKVNVNGDLKIPGYKPYQTFSAIVKRRTEEVTNTSSTLTTKG